MMSPIIECVPNFSEGRNVEVINQIVAAISSVADTKILHVDSGYAANRTVVTFVGPPEAVVESAFRGARVASELIDMQQHQGEHPRFGAIDVLPLIPLRGISMDRVILLARSLAKRIAQELRIPTYCYADAAFTEKKRDLAFCRQGEYEGLSAKMKKTEEKPDYAPEHLNIRSGACAVGARNILIAYNVNLNTTSARLAHEVAMDIRESGRPLFSADGCKQYHSDGSLKRIPGTLSSVKAIGWYIDDFKQAQVSINITNISRTPLHVVFEEVVKMAQMRGMRVTGSEIVGLVPLHSILEAGEYYLQKQGHQTKPTEKELIHVASLSLGLNDVCSFSAQEKIIEYAMCKHDDKFISQ